MRDRTITQLAKREYRPKKKKTNLLTDLTYLKHFFFNNMAICKRGSDDIENPQVRSPAGDRARMDQRYGFRRGDVTTVLR